MNKSKKSFILLILVLIFLNTSIKQSNAQFSDRPLFVEISTDWCYACNILKPTIEELKTELGNEITFVRLNFSDENTSSESMKLAESLGITDFVSKSKHAFPTVGILCSSGISAEKLIVGANPKEVYIQAINELTNSGKICSFSSFDGITGSNQNNLDLGSGRPEVVVSTDRPIEFSGSGRPETIRFWGLHEEIPLSAYYNFVKLPDCNGSINTLCTSYIPTPSIIKVDIPVNNSLEPFDPNPSRDEKGYTGQTLGNKKKK